MASKQITFDTTWFSFPKENKKKAANDGGGNLFFPPEEIRIHSCASCCCGPENDPCGTKALYTPTDQDIIH